MTIITLSIIGGGILLICILVAIFIKFKRSNSLTISNISRPYVPGMQSWPNMSQTPSLYNYKHQDIENYYNDLSIVDYKFKHNDTYIQGLFDDTNNSILDILIYIPYYIDNNTSNYSKFDEYVNKYKISALYSKYLIDFYINTHKFQIIYTVTKYQNSSFIYSLFQVDSILFSAMMQNPIYITILNILITKIRESVKNDTILYDKLGGIIKYDDSIATLFANIFRRNLLLFYDCNNDNIKTHNSDIGYKYIINNNIDIMKLYNYNREKYTLITLLLQIEKKFITIDNIADIENIDEVQVLKQNMSDNEYQNILLYLKNIRDSNRKCVSYYNGNSNKTIGMSGNSNNLAIDIIWHSIYPFIPADLYDATAKYYEFGKLVK